MRVSLLTFSLRRLSGCGSVALCIRVWCVMEEEGGRESAIKANLDRRLCDEGAEAGE